MVTTTPPVKQLEAHEVEGVCLNDLHKDRDRVKYVKMLAERKMKVRIFHPVSEHVAIERSTLYLTVFSHTGS